MMIPMFFDFDKYLFVVRQEHYYIGLNFEEYYGGREFKRYKDLPRGKGLVTLWLIAGKNRERILSENIKSDPKIERLGELIEEAKQLI